MKTKYRVIQRVKANGEIYYVLQSRGWNNLWLGWLDCDESDIADDLIRKASNLNNESKEKQIYP